MIEKVSLDRINSLHPKIREEVKELYIKASGLLQAGTTLRITEAYRIIEYQNALYAQGRTKSGNIVTKSKGGQSYHNYGLAFDFCLIIDGKAAWKVNAEWMKVVNTFKQAGYTWGGDFKSIVDPPHLEKTFGYNWRQLLDMYNKKQLVNGTEYVNI